VELTIDELAQRAQLPVRTLREYHTMRLLPPTGRRGRVGVYGDQHVERLELIARLQRRGYSLAGIRDLLGAWDAGTDLTTLLGVDSGPAALDETPLVISRAELAGRLPAPAADSIDRAAAAGLIVPRGDEHFLVRSPALLALVADAVRAGVPLDQVLDLAATLTGGLGTLAGDLAAQLEQILRPLATAGDVGQLASLLQRWRVLWQQGAASILTDRLGAALIARAEGGPGGPGGPGEPGADGLLAALDRIRIGVTTDTAGRIRHHRR
jgi:DNA-binding transcriptional MerR regulator